MLCLGRHAGKKLVGIKLSRGDQVLGRSHDALRSVSLQCLGLESLCDKVEAAGCLLHHGRVASVSMLVAKYILVSGRWGAEK